MTDTTNPAAPSFLDTLKERVVGWLHGQEHDHKQLLADTVTELHAVRADVEALKAQVAGQVSEDVVAVKADVADLKTSAAPVVAEAEKAAGSA